MAWSMTPYGLRKQNEETSAWRPATTRQAAPWGRYVLLGIIGLVLLVLLLHLAGLGGCTRIKHSMNQIPTAIGDRSDEIETAGSCRIDQVVTYSAIATVGSSR